MAKARPLLVVLHRVAGLFIAGFLVIAGLTGAVISWDHELDALLNGHLLQARASGQAQPSLDLAREVEARHPHAEVVEVPVVVEPGHALVIGVEPRVNPETERLYDLGFNQVFVDPVSGAELGRRDWGAVWPLSRENFVSFLYVLHYSLHIPGPWGVWFMGFVACIWTLDCFGGLLLTLPRPRTKRAVGEKALRARLSDWMARWAPAWRIKTSGGRYRINFDIHRAAGLWTWGLLFVLAFTAFSLNLYGEVFRPVIATVSEVTPSPFNARSHSGLHSPLKAQLSFEEVIERADREAQRRGWRAPIGNVFYARYHDVFVVFFFEPGDDHGAAGLGPPVLYFDGANGLLLGDFTPWRGTAADIFVQAQFPVHSGRILGLPGRILISVMGIVVAALSVTGVVIWWKKHKARALRKTKTAPSPPAAALAAK
ncbi:MAG: PepSY-associated TM helix domain-containing protein [Pseudomonadota bacterium]